MTASAPVKALNPTQRVRVLGASLTNLADRMEGGEDKSLTLAFLNYVLAEIRATKQALKGER